MRILVGDAESTGVDVHNDRIIQWFLGLMDENGEWILQQEWIIDPGVEIPEEAAAVHGMDTAFLRANGTKDVRKALEQIATIIRTETADGQTPFLAYNASFDASILNAELVRHGLEPIAYPPTYVLDPLVLWKKIDRFRKGKRTLQAAAEAYRVPVDPDRLHDAAYDCLLAGRVGLKMLEQDLLRGMPLNVIHEASVAWRREQCESLQEYFRKTDPEAVVNPGWPLVEVAA